MVLWLAFVGGLIFSPGFRSAVVGLLHLAPGNKRLDRIERGVWTFLRAAADACHAFVHPRALLLYAILGICWGLWHFIFQSDAGKRSIGENFTLLGALQTGSVVLVLVLTPFVLIVLAAAYAIYKAHWHEQRELRLRQRAEVDAPRG